MNRLILFLIRKKFHLKKWEKFQFENQKNKTDYYYFNKDKIIKVQQMKKPIRHSLRTSSNVSLNWLLNKDCKIVKSIKGGVLNVGARYS